MVENAESSDHLKKTWILLVPAQQRLFAYLRFKSHPHIVY